MFKNTKVKTSFFILFCISLSFFIQTEVASAQCVSLNPPSNGSDPCVGLPISSCTGTCLWTGSGESTNNSGAGSGGPVSLPNPLPGNTTDINTLIGQVINGVLGIVGSLALLMFIYGGLMWMLAAGSAERVKKGKDILIWAVIGLIVIFSAYALVKFIFTNALSTT